MTYFSAQYENAPSVGFPDYDTLVCRTPKHRPPQHARGDLCPLCRENTRGCSPSGKPRSYCAPCAAKVNRATKERARNAKLRPTA